MIETIHLIPQLDNKLIELLRSLDDDDWKRPTLAKLWSVKDIAAHLLDGNMRTLSLSRDKHLLIPDQPINSYESLVSYLNRLNADWVKACVRLSPKVLTDLLELTGQQYSAHLAELDPHGDAIFSVAWAGEDVSKNWFHIAREYTEKFHHQQQIREACGKGGIMTREFFYPFISTLLQALPHTYRNTEAEEGSGLNIIIDTEIGGSWQLVRLTDKWILKEGSGADSYTSLIIPPSIAWKLFTKGLSPYEAEVGSTIRGNKEFARVALSMIAIMG
ncbi:MAG: maleylpyruvate isomerase N-terminal domain-containing protein [Chitinophagaceae bacterium]|nr:maleylpyruvate isomerase N-terminal domain-containing protein [Chitinophagaceae bacterium]